MKPTALLPCLGLLLAACAWLQFEPTSVVPGDTQDDVVRKMGSPTAVYTMPDGRPRMEYNHMPEGRKTYMIDFDDSGHVTHWEQVLDEQHFAAIVPGMHSTDVLRLIGPPSERGAYARPEPGRTWSYRYEVYPRCQLFQVALDARTDEVVAAYYPPDRRCEGGGDHDGRR
jgi:outer membrane protein assembly factor BamE (lipoprotein component of BamABCDE complex)